MTAVREKAGSRRMREISVVLPLPRKPVTIATGIMTWGGNGRHSADGRDGVAGTLRRTFGWGDRQGDRLCASALSRDDRGFAIRGDGDQRTGRAGCVAAGRPGGVRRGGR